MQSSLGEKRCRAASVGWNENCGSTVIELMAGNGLTRQLKGSTASAQRPQQQPQRQQQHQDDQCDQQLCALCNRCVVSTGGRSTAADDVDLDDRHDSNDEIQHCWRRVPCDCLERYVHMSCLETGYYEDTVHLAAGGGHLLVTCRTCGVQLQVRRQRGRRTCDRQAWLAFARHLACAAFVAGLPLVFGLWSLVRNNSRTTVVNAGLVALGGALLLGFACLELWLLHARFEFAFKRQSPAAAQKGQEIGSSNSRGAPSNGHGSGHGGHSNGHSNGYGGHGNRHVGHGDHSNGRGSHSNGHDSQNNSHGSHRNGHGSHSNGHSSHSNSRGSHSNGHCIDTSDDKNDKVAPKLETKANGKTSKARKKSVCGASNGAFESAYL